MYYAATLWFLVTASSQRNDLVCSLAHLVIVIVATIEAELVLWVALGYRSALHFAIRWLQVWILLHQLQLSLLIKHCRRISDQLAPTFQWVRPIHIRVNKACCLFGLPWWLLNFLPFEDSIWLRSIRNVCRTRTLRLKLLPLLPFDLAIHLRILCGHALDSRQVIILAHNYLYVATITLIVHTLIILWVCYNVFWSFFSDQAVWRLILKCILSQCLIHYSVVRWWVLAVSLDELGTFWVLSVI